MDDYIPIPEGTEFITEVPLAGNIRADGKPGNVHVKTVKPGAWFSVDAQKDALKARAK